MSYHTGHVHTRRTRAPSLNALPHASSSASVSTDGRAKAIFKYLRPHKLRRVWPRQARATHPGSFASTSSTIRSASNSSGRRSAAAAEPAAESPPSASLHAPSGVRRRANARGHGKHTDGGCGQRCPLRSLLVRGVHQPQHHRHRICRRRLRRQHDDNRRHVTRSCGTLGVRTIE